MPTSICPADSLPQGLPGYLGVLVMRKSTLSLFVSVLFPLVYAPVNAQDFNPLDLTGIWVADQPNEAGRSISANRPPMTEWGLERFNAVRSSRTDMPWSNASAGAPQEEQNDGVEWCDPIGYPRVIWEPQARTMRFVQTDKVLVQMFDWHRNWRDIWLDGRDKVDIAPRWWGLATAEWQGDTLHVESYGFNDRTWLDPYGSPHSSEMRLEETFHRTGPDTMEWTLTVIDPVAYTAPWVMGDSEQGNKRMLRRVDIPLRAESEELTEDMCIWSDQAYFYQNTDATGLGIDAVIPPEMRK